MVIKYPHLVLSGILCGIGLLISDVWFLSIVGLLPFIHFLYRGSPENAWIIFKGVALFGVVYVATALIWFWHVLPLDWLGSGSIASSAIVFFSWGIVALSLGVTFGIFSIVFLILRQNNPSDVLLFSALFVLTQYLQMWVFTFVTWGTSSLLGAHFSAVFLGYALASFSPLLQLASIGGIYLLTFTAVLFALLFYYLLLHNRRWRAFVFSSTIALAIFLTVTDHREPLTRTAADPEAGFLRVALISTSFSPDIPQSEADKAFRRNEQLRVVHTWMKEHDAPDLLVFPETADVFPQGAADVESLQRSVFGTTSIAIIDSTLVTRDVDNVQRMYFWRSSPSEIPRTYDKLFLVPQGEYEPWFASVPMRLFDASRISSDTRHSRTTLMRGEAQTIFSHDKATIGALFCSEILSPTLYRELVDNGASILVNASSLAGFHGSPLVDSFVLTIAKVRAVENNRFLAIAAHEAPASIISARGEVIARSTSGVTSILSSDVPLIYAKTIYTQTGDLVLVLPALFVLPYLYMRYVHRNPSSGLHAQR